MRYLRTKLFWVACVTLTTLFILISCGSKEDSESSGGISPATNGETEASGATSETSNETARPEDWSEETHGISATPNYDLVFAEGKVHRIDVIITAENWEKMLANMTELYGEFGRGGGPGGWPANGGCGMGPAGENEGPGPSGGCGGGWSPGGCDGAASSDEDATGDADIPEIPPEGEGNFPGGAMPPEGGDAADNAMPSDDSEPPDGGMPPSQGGGFPNGGMPMEFSTENPEWFPCTVSYNDHTWTHVGIRFKGNSSLSSTWSSGSYKLPYRFNFDKFEDDYPEIDGQRFYGFKKISLSSNWSDDSLLRDRMVPDIFRAAGVPAPRTAFYQLYVDHGDGPVYVGLYTMIEIPDAPMLNSQFTAEGGNLYKPEGEGATFAVYNEDSFDKETNEDEADFSDVLALYEALNADRTDIDQWKENLESIFNVDGFIRWLAVNTLIQNWDTYGRMSHNYFLYNDPGDGRLHWIPWDNNMAMGSSFGKTLSLYLTPSEVGDGWPLIRYLMDDEVYWQRYVSYVKETAENVFYPGRMKEIYANAYELIQPYILDENSNIIETYTLLKSADAFTSSIETLNDHVDGRHAAALQFLSDNP